MDQITTPGLGKLPAGWTWKTMDEIADVIGGGTPKTNDSSNYEGGKIPWITPADLSGYAAKYIGHGERFITEKGLKDSSARMMPAGTILFSSRAPVGYVVIASNPVCTNQGFKSFVLKKGDVLPDYVYWWLKGNKDLAESMSSGTTFLELSGAKAKQLPIPIAPLNEQKLIVAEIEKQFSRLDEAVANLKRVKANLKRYKAAVLKAAVEGKLTEEWRKAQPDVEPASGLLKCILAERRQKWEDAELAKMKAKVKVAKKDKWTKKYKEPSELDISDLPELPTGWSWVSLETVTDAIGGYAFESKRFSESGYQIVKMANVKMGKIDLSQQPSFISDVESEVVNKYSLIPGDILVTLTGTRKKRDYGYIAVVKDKTKILLNQRIVRLRPYGKILPKYIEIAMQNEVYRNRFFSYETGNVGQGNVGMSAVTKEPIALPPAEEQKVIVAEIDRHFSIAEEVEATINANLARAESLRQSLLYKAFCGKLS